MKFPITISFAVFALASHLASAVPVENVPATIALQKRVPAAAGLSTVERYMNHLQRISNKYSVDVLSKRKAPAAGAETGADPEDPEDPDTPEAGTGKPGAGQTGGKPGAGQTGGKPGAGQTGGKPGAGAGAGAGAGSGAGADGASLPLTPEAQDEAYFGTVTVGGQDFNIDFDTGSSDLWVPSTTCRSRACGKMHLYDEKKSQTFKDAGKSFSITYGSGAVSGKLGVETVKIAGLVANDQFLGIADTVSDDFAQGHIDGLMGMAFSSINTAHKDTVFDTLIKQKAVSKPVFAFHLTRSAEGGKGASLTLGGIDSSKFTGDIQFVPVTQKTFWTVSADGATVNGKSAGVSKRSAAIDTGTTLIVMPPEDAKAIMSKIPGAQPLSQGGQDSGLFQFPCNSQAQVALSFGGKSFDVNPKDFNLGQVSSGSQDCVAGIAGMDVGADGIWIVGDVFLKNWYSIYDAGNNQVGFAKSV